MHPLIEIKKATLLPVITFLLTLFAFNPLAQAVVPPPDGGYPGGNTAEGQDALFSLTTGGFNTAVGFFSLRANTITSFNTAIGAGTLLANTAEENTATGAGALLSNTRGHQNTANGAFALFSNTMGVVNTANGAFALYSNTDGNNNTANGAFALYSNTTGSENTANGTVALQLNSTGLQNTAIGFGALGFNTTGAGNTAIGYQALLENQTGSYNIVLGGGHNVTAGDFNIYIGNDGVDFESNTIRIGNPLHSRTFIAGINGATASGGTAVHVNSDGQLGTVTSSARFKDDIEPMDRASEALFGLKPVSFRYKKQIDAKGTPQFGLVAEDVAKVNPDLVILDRQGQPYSVRYEQVNAMLLNEFLKGHRKNEEQQATIARHQKQIEALTAEFQKVSTQLEMIRPLPQTALNNP